MLATSTHVLFVLFYYFLRLPFAVGVLQTGFIDDQHGDSLSKASLRFTGPWNRAPPCQGCALQPNPDLAFGGTWTDITHRKDKDPVSFIEITFVGIAIDVLCIIPYESPSKGVVVTYDLKITLDGLSVGSGFYNKPSNLTGNNFFYNVSVFSIGGLDNKPHKLVLNATSTSRDSVVLFDYAKYIYDNETVISSTSETTPDRTAPVSGSGKSEADVNSNSSNNPSHRNATIIAVVSVLATLILITLAALFIIYGSRRFGWRLHQRKQKQEPSDFAPQSRRHRPPPPPHSTTTSLSNPENGFSTRIQRWATQVAGHKLVHPFSPPSNVPSTCRSQASITPTPPSRDRSHQERHPHTQHPPRKTWVVCNPSSSSEGRSTR